MANYLVTGGCGFIGSHLCATLVDTGHTVRVLDDLSTGSIANLTPRADFIRGDITDPDAVREAMRGMDGCFHLAAIASVERGTQDWLGTHRVNLTGMLAVLDAARPSVGQGSAIPVVYASSAAVYGDNQDLPLREASTPRPLSAYGADKLGCELHARVGGAVHGVPTAGLRFFNVFGPRQDPKSPYSGVISIFCDRLTRGEAVVIYGDGGQSRDFVYVTDVVAALIAAVASASTEAPVSNVCSGRETSVLDLANMIARACGVELQIDFKAPRKGEIRHSLGANGQLSAKLGVRPTVEMQQGIEAVVSWIRDGQPGLS